MHLLRIPEVDTNKIPMFKKKNFLVLFYCLHPSSVLAMEVISLNSEAFYLVYGMLKYRGLELRKFHKSSL